MDSSSNVQMLFVLRPDFQKDPARLPLETWWRSLPKDGAPAANPRPLVITPETSAPTQEEAVLLRRIAPYADRQRPHLHHLPAGDFAILEALRNIPHLRWADKREGFLKLHPLSFSRMLPAKFHLEFQPQANGHFHVHAAIRTSAESLPLSRIRCICNAPRTAPGTASSPFGLALCEDRLLSVDFLLASEIAGQFLLKEYLPLDPATASALCHTISLETNLDETGFPPSIRHARIANLLPLPSLFVRTAKYKYKNQEQLHAELSFQYGRQSVPSLGETPHRLQDGLEILERNYPAEEKMRQRLVSLGFRMATRAWEEEPGWKLSPALLERAILTLVQEGWEVHAEGKNYRRPVVKTPSVSYGIQWFELDAGLSFDGKQPPLPALLAAVHKKQPTVLLDDGTYGILPQEWLEKFTALTELGQVKDNAVRFRMGQAAIVNALLDEQLTADNEQLRQAIQSMEDTCTPRPASPPQGFLATLRPYQSEGLGWLLCMRRLGLGVCLADDMGLGKTVQILALLASNRQREKASASLVVVPRSLLFNWQEEARKFAPELRVALYWGAGRICTPEFFRDADLVLTTYGTVRNDVAVLARIPFDSCVLDESQAIKNAESSTARAVRCLRARHRIAMTGTPIENHLGELFSQLSFLNPGLFGHGSLPFSYQPSLDNPRRNSALAKIRTAVRPFFLRRTKQQVATELPPKTELLQWIVMPEEEQRRYNELRDWYLRQLENPSEKGQGMHALAALTRLRQAACHPGLLKNEEKNAASAKLDWLRDTLLELTEAGHKALVFSQFTEFLHILENVLLEYGVGYCYLDGTTANRPEQVRQFQEDPDKKVFLISLKAGGTGLNLTAADYVFLTDPWWNPAAEAQAIDRAYRIGQEKPVFAYRLITRDTVEEKVYQLQQGKQALANAVMQTGETTSLDTAEDALDTPAFSLSKELLLSLLR